jgi:hypothetical protein
MTAPRTRSRVGASEWGAIKKSATPEQYEMQQPWRLPRLGKPEETLRANHADEPEGGDEETKQNDQK